MNRVDEYKRKSFEKHILTEWRGGPDVRGFCMREPGTMMMSCTILGYRDGVAIMGDIAPGRGVCIERKDIAWFAGDLSESYLLEKSNIAKFWQAECAAEYFEDFVGTIPKIGLEEKEEWDVIIRRLKAGEMDVYELAEDLQTVGFPTNEGIPGLDYNREDAAWLCAIQQRFKVLYAALEATNAGG